MDAAVLTLISTMFVALLGNSWHQTRENSKTRELMIQLNDNTRLELKNLGNELRADHKQLRADHKQLGDELRTAHKQLGDDLRTDIRHLSDGLGHVRERLSRIEGHLRINGAHPAGSTTDD